MSEEWKGVPQWLAYPAGDTPPPQDGAEADKAAADAFVALNVDQTADLCERVLVLYPTHPLIQRLAVECRGVCRSHQNMDSAYKAAAAEVTAWKERSDRLCEEIENLRRDWTAAEAALAEANRRGEEMRDTLDVVRSNFEMIKRNTVAHSRNWNNASLSMLLIDKALGPTP